MQDRRLSAMPSLSLESQEARGEAMPRSYESSNMPSSLMARVKAAQSSSSSSPPSSISSSSAAPKKTSSLAAAATSTSGRLTTNRGGSHTSNTKSTYVPSYKLNPLNAASIRVSETAVKITAAAEITADDDSSSNIIPNKQNDYMQKEVKSANISTTALSTMATTPEKKKKKTVIEQLLQCQDKQQSSAPRIYPAEYFMCSQSEALDRQTHMELSPFECYPSSLLGSTAKISIVSKNENDSSNDGTTAFSSRQCSTKFVNNNNNSAAATTAATRRLRPKYHAQYVVKKYRRSAAGGGTLSDISEGNIRSLEQLNGTVDYLIEDVFVWQMPPPVIATTCTTTDDASSSATWSAGRRSGDGDDDPNEISIWEENDDDDQLQLQLQPQQHTPFSLSDTVAFIDDRLRAVQKDLVTLLGNLEQDNYHVGSNSNNNSIASKRLHLKQLQLKQTVRKMQSKMVRYNILTSYLLSDVPPSKYEIKFGARALRTSLTSYLNLSSTLDDEYNDIAKLATARQQSQYKRECQTKDEIMAYMALLHSSAVLRSEEQALPPSSSSSSGEVTSSLMEESGSGWGALLSTFCKHVISVDAAGGTRGGGASRHDNNNSNGDGCCSKDCQESLVEKYPRWKWALTLACLAQEGNFQGYLKLLRNGPSTVVSSSTTTLTKEEEVDNARFLLLARCCASHSLNLIRLGQLRRYNHSFGKGEKISGKDLARLLHLDDDDDGDDERSAKLAIDFCRDAGLPIVEKDGEESIELYVAMKSAPISISKDGPIKRMCNPGRRNDGFVFGSCFEDASRRVDLLTNQLKDCGIRQNVEDWEDNVEADDDAKSSCLSNKVVKIEARVDENGVAIPSSEVIRTLMG